MTSYKGVVKIFWRANPDCDYLEKMVVTHKNDLLKLFPNLDELIIFDAEARAENSQPQQVDE